MCIPNIQFNQKFGQSLASYTRYFYKVAVGAAGRFQCGDSMLPTLHPHVTDACTPCGGLSRLEYGVLVCPTDRGMNEILHWVRGKA